MMVELELFAVVDGEALGQECAEAHARAATNGMKTMKP